MTLRAVFFKSLIQRIKLFTSLNSLYSMTCVETFLHSLGFVSATSVAMVTTVVQEVSSGAALTRCCCCCCSCSLWLYNICMNVKLYKSHRVNNKKRYWSIYTGVFMTSHSISIIINMEPPPILQLQQLLLFWEGSLHILKCVSLLKFIPDVLDVVEVRALCGPVKFCHTKLTQPCLYGPCFVHWGRVLLEQKRAFPKLLPQSWKHRILQNVLVS